MENIMSEDVNATQEQPVGEPVQLGLQDIATMVQVIDIVSNNGDLEKFIKIINPEDRVYNMGLKKYRNFTPSKIIKDDRQDSLLLGFNITNDGKGNPIIEVLDN